MNWRAIADHYAALASDFKRNGSHESARFYTEVARRYEALAEAQ
jgi:hypothetical protein